MELEAQPVAKSDRRGQALELKHLRFAAIAYKCGSFRKAAELLSIQHSALSRSMAQLEHLVGATLFERSAAGVRPTFAGQKFAKRANAILAQLDALVNSTGSIANAQSPNLSVGLCTSVTTGIARDLLRDFRRRCAGIKISAIERSPAGLHRSLQSNGLDIIIASTPLAPDARPLWRERVLVLLPADHALALRKNVYWKDLHNQTFLLVTRDRAGGLEEMIESKVLIHGIAENVQRHDASRHLIYELTGMGLGVSFILNSDIGVVGPDVVCREMHDERGPMRICFYGHWLPGNDNPALHAFLTFLSARYPPLPAGER